jgi:CheY-like chemotaxis protein
MIRSGGSVNRDTPIIAVTANAMKGDVDKVLPCPPLLLCARIWLLQSECCVTHPPSSLLSLHYLHSPTTCPPAHPHPLPPLTYCVPDFHRPTPVGPCLADAPSFLAPSLSLLPPKPHPHLTRFCVPYSCISTLLNALFLPPSWPLQCLSSGMNDYIPKPISIRQLQMSIHTWIAPAADTGSASPATVLKG